MPKKSEKREKLLDEVNADSVSVMELVKENEALKKKIKELEAENKELLIAKTPKTRGDHEIIFNGEHYFINFNELLDFFDKTARGSIRQPGLYGAVGAHNALAKILSLGDGDEFHEGVEKARQLILKYAG